MRNVFLIGTCLCGLVAASDAPHAGKWKMNVAKSNFGDTTVSYEQLPGGGMSQPLETGYAMWAKQIVRASACGGHRFTHRLPQFFDVLAFGGDRSYGDTDHPASVESSGS
jgi:hypothetical protein